MSEQDRILGECLEDYGRRRRTGVDTNPDQYREVLGPGFTEFEELLRAEEALDKAMEPGVPDDEFPKAFGEYTLLSELGRGAVGIVYEARHEGLGRRVALKVLRTGFDTNDTARERFRREARACAQVRHDHIVDIYEAGEVDDRPYYAMTILEGEPLSKLVRENRVMDSKTLAASMADIADALQALHDRHIVHRDVKPSNIMVEPSGRMVLADFGLARSAESAKMTRTGDALGTPLYMSPEQMMGDGTKIDGRTDVYGLGATLYEIVSARPPFETSDLSTLMGMVLKERPKAPRHVNRDTPQGLEQIILKCLEKRRGDRYQSAGELAEDLRHFANDEKVIGRPVSRARHGMRVLTDHPVALAASVLIAIGAAIFFASRPVADAELTLLTLPSGEIAINDGAWQQTPVTVAMRPGNVRVAMRAQGFVDRTVEFETKPGGSYEKEFALIVANNDDEQALQRFAEAHNLGAVQLAKLERHRGSGDPPSVALLYPRGDVRAEDLDSFRVDAADLVEGHIVFRQDKTELGRVAFAPEDAVSVIEMPAKVRAAAKDKAITWSFVPNKSVPKTGDTISASFTLRASDELDANLAKVESTLADKGSMKTPAVRAYLRSQVFLQGGFDTAAFRTLGAVTGDRKQGGAAALKLQLESLRRMFDNDDEKVVELRAGETLISAIDALK